MSDKDQVKINAAADAIAKLLRVSLECDCLPELEINFPHRLKDELLARVNNRTAAVRLSFDEKRFMSDSEIMISGEFEIPNGDVSVEVTLINSEKEPEAKVVEMWVHKHTGHMLHGIGSVTADELKSIGYELRRFQEVK